MDLLITGDIAILSAITGAARKLGCHVIVIKNKDEKFEDFRAIEKTVMEQKMPMKYKLEEKNDFISKKMNGNKERWQK